MELQLLKLDESYQLEEQQEQNNSIDDTENHSVKENFAETSIENEHEFF